MLNIFKPEKIVKSKTFTSMLEKLANAGKLGIKEQLIILDSAENDSLKGSVLGPLAVGHHMVMLKLGTPHWCMVDACSQ